MFGKGGSSDVSGATDRTLVSAAGSMVTEGAPCFTVSQSKLSSIGMAPSQTVFRKKVLYHWSGTFSENISEQSIMPCSSALPESISEQSIMTLEWHLARQYFRTNYYNIGVAPF